MFTMFVASSSGIFYDGTTEYCKCSGENVGGTASETIMALFYFSTVYISNSEFLLLWWKSGLTAPGDAGGM